jgi:PAT family beta-lactamase induction signal transducer AmpG
MAAYGFMSGLPLLLSGFTLRLWLTERGVGLGAVVETAWIGYAYSLKFLWAPVLDRMPPVALVRRFGRRRGWLMLIQPVLAAAILALALSGAGPGLSFAAAACVAVLSATQDIAIDAWRIEVFPEQRQGQALAVYVWGYRVALLVANSGVIALADRSGWPVALGGMAVLLALLLPVTFAAANPGSTNQGPTNQGPAGPGAANPGAVVRTAPGLRTAVVEPLRAFLGRSQACMTLCFIALFKLGEGLAGVVTAPFYHALGFGNDAIAAAGPFSLGGTLAGITLGGWLVARAGAGRALLLTGWMQTLAMGMYVLLSRSPGGHAVLYGTVLAEAFAQGMADAAFLTFLSGLCDRRFAATQYALLSAVPRFTIDTLGGFSGRIAAQLGWTPFYVLCMGAALPGMALMMVMLRRAPRA